MSLFWVKNGFLETPIYSRNLCVSHRCSILLLDWRHERLVEQKTFCYIHLTSEGHAPSEHAAAMAEVVDALA